MTRRHLARHPPRLPLTFLWPLRTNGGYFEQIDPDFDDQRREPIVGSFLCAEDADRIRRNAPNHAAFLERFLCRVFGEAQMRHEPALWNAPFVCAPFTDQQNFEATPFGSPEGERAGFQ